MRAGKATCLAQIEEIREELAKADVLIASLKQELDAIEVRNAPMIDRLQQEADALATMMRDCFRRSQEAYQAEDGETAKILSEEGKEYRRQSEELNSQANALRKEHKDTFDILARWFEYVKVLRGKLKAAYEELKIYRRTRVSGFADVSFVTSLQIEKALDKLPQEIIKNVAEVSFVSGPQSGDLGVTLWPTGKQAQAVIKLYRHPLELPEKNLKASLINTLVHELGHVIWEKNMTLEERRQWRDQFNRDLSDGAKFVSRRAAESSQEDFSECFRHYHLANDNFRRVDPVRYNTLKQVMDRAGK